MPKVRIIIEITATTTDEFDPNSEPQVDSLNEDVADMINAHIRTIESIKQLIASVVTTEEL